MVLLACALRYPYDVILFDGFAQLIVDRGGKTDGGKGLLGAVFELDEALGADELLEGAATEIGDGENALGGEAGFFENLLDVFWMIIVEAIFADFFVVGYLLVPRVDFAAAGNIASHFGQSAFVGDFYDGDATRL